MPRKEASPHFPRTASPEPSHEALPLARLQRGPGPTAPTAAKTRPPDTAVCVDRDASPPRGARHVHGSRPPIYSSPSHELPHSSCCPTLSPETPFTLSSMSVMFMQ